MSETARPGALPERIEQIAEQIPGGFFIYRADEGEELLYVNEDTLRIFGCDTREEFCALTGNSFRGFIHPEDLDAVKASISEQVVESGDNLDYVEYRIVRKDGEIRWVDDYGRLVHTERDGDLYYVFMRDITDKHHAQEENRRRAEVIEGLSVDFGSIYLLNLDSGTMRPYRLQTGYFRELTDELKARGDPDPDWRSVLPLYAERYVLEADRELYLRETAEAHIRARLERERSYTVEYRCLEKNGDVAYIQMSVVRIDGESLGHHAVMGYRDVTEQVHRVQREAADRLRMELELEQEKRANEIKSSFLFNISHDIRTPMNAIMGFTALAKGNIDRPERLKSYLEKVDESNHHLLALIDDLLEMSRIDYGRIEIKTEVCDLREQLEIVLDMLAPEAETKHLTLETELNLPEADVYADAPRFRRIMANLIGNAVKFTPDGGAVKVTARQKHVSESGYARFEFTVSDNGVGMSEEFMRRMFEAFEREETSTKSGYRGTGLGLSIVKSLLDVMGGSITVKSKKGEGSTFTVDLPLKLADQNPEDAPVYVTAELHKAAGEHRILLVEDIEINRMLAETILEEAEFLVESVPDGCDAVDAIRDHPPYWYDLVLMDIQMPVMNGYEATRAIRALGREDTDTLPIIALSANARDEDKRMSMESGMDNHIAKPFDIAHLITTVNEHIAAREKSE